MSGCCFRWCLVVSHDLRLTVLIEVMLIEKKRIGDNSSAVTQYRHDPLPMHRTASLPNDCLEEGLKYHLT